MANSHEDEHEDEIYSIMFSSLKHPVRRKILRMLGMKNMTFMELVEELGVSSPHLTYHLENLGELVSKLDNGQYKLSTFGLATVNAMKGVEEVHEIEPKRRMMTRRWKGAIGVLLVAVLILAGMSAVQYVSINQLSSSQKSLALENQQLMSQNVGTGNVVNFLQNVTQISPENYSISQMGNTMQWRADFGGVAEQTLQYSLTSDKSNLNVDFRFRNNHFSRYDLDMIETTPIFTQVQPDNVIDNAMGVLVRYRAFSGDAYLTSMINLLANVTAVSNTEITQGNMALQIGSSGGSVTFLWMYTAGGIDYQAKGLQMNFTDNILTTMTDGYFLFTVGSTSLSISQSQAVNIAENYAKNTMAWTIEGTQITGFPVASQPLAVQLVPHPRGNSVALIPYWYVEMSLTNTYPGGYNEVTVGIYADTGQVADTQLLATNT